MPALLKQHGYLTACIGKWHLGWDWPRKDEQSEPDFTQPIANGPITRGFDEYFGTHVPNQPPYAFIENDRLTRNRRRSFPARIRNCICSRAGRWFRDGSLKTSCPRSPRGWETTQRPPTDQKLFFLYYSLTIPHEPLRLRRPFWKERHQPGWRLDYANRCRGRRGAGCAPKAGLGQEHFGHLRIRQRPWAQHRRAGPAPGGTRSESAVPWLQRQPIGRRPPDPLIVRWPRKVKAA